MQMTLKHFSDCLFLATVYFISAPHVRTALLNNKHLSTNTKQTVDNYVNYQHSPVKALIYLH